jgi:hypothetical protein
MSLCTYSIDLAYHYTFEGKRWALSSITSPADAVIPVVMNMFRLLDFLKSNKMVRNSLKLL